MRRVNDRVHRMANVGKEALKNLTARPPIAKYSMSLYKHRKVVVVIGKVSLLESVITEHNVPERLGWKKRSRNLFRLRWFVRHRCEWVDIRKRKAFDAAWTLVTRNVYALGVSNKCIVSESVCRTLNVHDGKDYGDTSAPVDYILLQIAGTGSGIEYVEKEDDSLLFTYGVRRAWERVRISEGLY
jgi:hypothetical protein